MKRGDKLPSLTFSSTNNAQDSFANYQGKWLILYFYPKDATPGCTTQGQEFRDSYAKFQALNAEILGVSRDSLQSHEKFKSQQQFPFALVSDPEEALCQHFSVMKMKSMYGKQVRGVERSTFLINPKGIMRHEWRNVKVKDHVAMVLNALREQAPSRIED